TMQAEAPFAITLAGSATDPDNNLPLTYSWTQTVGPPVTLANSTGPSPSFTPAFTGTYTFKLVASDTRAGSSLPSFVTINAIVNHRPVANAGSPQSLFIGRSGSVFVQLS